MISAEHLKIIQKAAYKVRKFYTFDIYDMEDIEQEAVLIGLSIYKKWDGERDLESFMVFSMKNRLINLIKSNKCYANELPRRTDGITDSQLYEGEFPIVDAAELLRRIEESVPYTMRLDFLRMKDGITIPKVRRDEIIDTIRTNMNTARVVLFLETWF